MIVFALIITSFFLFLHPIDAGDFFHHLQSGEYIAQHRSLPYTDTATIAAYGRPWIDHSWGSGLLYYAVSTVGGLSGNSIMFALLGVVTTLLLYFLLKNKLSGTYTAALLSVFFATGLSLYWPSRPLVLGGLFILSLILLLSFYRKIRWYLPLLFLGWAIFYGASALLGLSVFILFLICSREKDYKDGLILVGCTVAACLNGYGLDSLLYAFKLPEMPYPQEWYPVYKVIQSPMLPATFIRVLFYGLSLVILLVTVILSFKNKSYKKNMFYSLLAFGAFLPFVSFRLITLVPVLIAPFVAFNLLSLQSMGKKTMYVITATSIAIFWVLRFLYMDFGLGMKPTFPVAAADFLKDHAIQGNILAPQEAGSYVSIHVPGSKIFVDTRDDLFVGTGVLEDKERLSSGLLDIATFTKKYDIDIIIGPMLNVVYRPLFYSDDWKLIYVDDTYFISVRNSVLENSSVTVLNYLDPTAEPIAKKSQTQEAVKQLENFISGKHISSRTHYTLASLLFSGGDLDGAQKQLDSINSSESPTDPNTEARVFLLRTAMELRNNNCTMIPDLLQEINGRVSNPLLTIDTYVREEFLLYSGDYQYICAGDETEGQKFYAEYLERSSYAQKEARVKSRLNYYRNLHKQ